MENKKESVFDKRGGDVAQEAKEFPIRDLGLLSTENSSGSKVYNKCTENIFRLLEKHPNYKGRFRYDEWTQKNEIKRGKQWATLDDSDFVPIQRDISARYPQFRMVSKDMVVDAILSACREHSYDRAVNYIRKIKWDGNGRIDTWLTKAYGAEDNAYHRAVGSNFFKGMAKRIIQPGCKFDTVMILEGKQGCGKSTSLSMIAGDWHLETTMKADNKDFFLQFRGKLIVEFSEGETLSRTETKNMKAMISTRIDTYRAPYERTMKDVPRRCVFAMSTNQDEYLKDESGNRRFFPVEVSLEKVDFKWLKENRDQMFAEALHRIEVLEETVYEYPDEAEAYQLDKMVRSPYEEAIEKWMESPFAENGIARNLATDGVSILEIWTFALLGDKAKIRKAEEMQVGLALRQMGFERRKTGPTNKRVWRWFLKKKIIVPHQDGQK